MGILFLNTKVEKCCIYVTTTSGNIILPRKICTLEVDHTYNMQVPWFGINQPGAKYYHSTLYTYIYQESQDKRIVGNITWLTIKKSLVSN